MDQTTLGTIAYYAAALGAAAVGAVDMFVFGSSHMGLATDEALMLGGFGALGYRANGVASYNLGVLHGQSKALRGGE